MSVTLQSPIRRRLALLMAVLLTLSVSGLGALPVAIAAGGHHYPAKVSAAFNRGCVKAATKNLSIAKPAARRYCRAAFRCIERRLTLKQFVRVVLDMEHHRHNSRSGVLKSCAKQASSKLHRRA